MSGKIKDTMDAVVKLNSPNEQKTQGYETIDGKILISEREVFFHNTLLLINERIEDELGINIRCGELESWQIPLLIRDESDTIRKYVKKHKKIIINIIENL